MVSRNSSLTLKSWSKSHRAWSRYEYLAFSLMYFPDGEWALGDGTNGTPLNLICTPQWVKEQEGNTFIGFKINYSPDAHKLEDFIKHLEKILKDDYPDIV